MSPVQASIEEALQTLSSLRLLEGDIVRAAELIKTCLAGGGKLLACGNGGSAADVSDFTTEFACRFVEDRQPYPAINLTADGALLTATANDYTFEEVFARQVRALGRPGDIFVAVSTSGRSRNITRALEEARRLPIQSIALLGRDGGSARGIATVDLVVPGQKTARIQEAHKFLFHVLCELVEPSLKK
jgi:D-sedoheptulose 7-phosphate isomerase